MAEEKKPSRNQIRMAEAILSGDFERLESEDRAELGTPDNIDGEDEDSLTADEIIGLMLEAVRDATKPDTKLYDDLSSIVELGGPELTEYVHTFLTISAMGDPLGDDGDDGSGDGDDDGDDELLGDGA